MHGEADTIRFAIQAEDQMIIQEWDTASLAQKERFARSIADRLHDRFEFTRLVDCHLADKQHIMAAFFCPMTHTDFMLLPGYEGVLGMEYHDALIPDEAHREWEQARYYDGRKDLPSYFAYVMTPPRQVTLPPFLCERIAVGLHTTQVYGHYPQNGYPIPRTEVAKDAQNLGFRFLTSDEWEYSCSGGSPTLFKWGNDWPPMAWMPMTHRPSDEWRLDQDLNAFGLAIAQDPYNVEYCLEGDVLRGGDGGGAFSSDGGDTAVWLTMATTFCYPSTPDFVELLRRPYLRRAVSLEQL